MRCQTLLTLCAGLAAAMPAAADITGYAVNRTVSYIQTSEAAPTAPDSWVFYTYVISDTNNETQWASVTFDRPPVQTMPLVEGTAVFWYLQSGLYADEATFLVEFPATTYTLAADRGAGTESGDVYLTEDLYCEAIPAFTGDTLSRLQGVDPDQTFIGTINGYTINPGTSVGGTWMSIVAHRATGAGAVWSEVLSPGDTFFVVPVGVLEPDTEYSIGITYTNTLETPGGWFGGGAVAGAEFGRATTAYFRSRSTPTCEADFNGDGNLDQDDVLALINVIAGGPCP